MIATRTGADDGPPSEEVTGTPRVPNTAATGAPTITGTAQVGETLTASTTGIADANGLTSPTYTYQWIRVDGTDEADIASANSSTYILVDADLGKTLKVQGDLRRRRSAIPRRSPARRRQRWARQRRPRR